VLVARVTDFTRHKFQQRLHYEAFDVLKPPWHKDGINLFIKMCLCLTDEKITKTQVYIHDVSQGNAVGVLTMLRFRQPGVQIPAEARSYCFLRNVHTDCEAKSEPFAGLNRPGRKDGHLLPSTAEVKNE
jgi:hypothetical protein